MAGSFLPFHHSDPEFIRMGNQYLRSAFRQLLCAPEPPKHTDRMHPGPPGTDHIRCRVAEIGKILRVQPKLLRDPERTGAAGSGFTGKRSV